MPHMILEYSKGLQSRLAANNVLSAAHICVCESGVFTPADVKSRSIAFEDIRVGAAGTPDDFVLLTLFILEGRALEIKQKLTADLFALLRAALPDVAQINVDLREFSREVYRK